jgi:MFS family permease
MVRAEAPRPPEPPRSLWRNTDYLLLWSGQTVSSLGSLISGVALPLLVLFLTGSPAQAGIVGALFGLPYLFLSLPAGVLVDRWDRKRTMILCDTGRAINSASIPLVFALGHLTIGQLYANALIEGSLFVLFNVAEIASLRQVVGTEQVAAASAQNEAASNATALVGPPLGGLVYTALGRAVPFGLDALSYAVSAASLFLIRTRFQLERTSRPGSFRAELTEGLRWVWREPLVRFLAFRAAGLNLVLNGTYLIVIVIARERHASPTLIGAMIALGSVGGLIGTFLSPRLQRRFRLGTLLVVDGWIQAILYPVLAVAPNALSIGLVYAAILVTGPAANAAVLSYRLALIPPDLQGRVNSAVRMIAYATIPLGSSIAGLLLQAISGSRTILIYAILLVVIAVAVTLNPHLRREPTPTP